MLGVSVAYVGSGLFPLLVGVLVAGLAVRSTPETLRRATVHLVVGFVFVVAATVRCGAGGTPACPVGPSYGLL